VTGTSAAGCINSNPAVSAITVNSLPSINVSTTSTVLCVGETATITASGASTLVFNPGGTGSVIAVSPTVTKTYTVTGTDANGCSNTSAFTQSVDACTSIKNEELKMKNSAFLIYPNPTRGLINLKLDSDTEIIIVNAVGQIVFSSKLNSGNQQINLEHLAKEFMW